MAVVGGLSHSALARLSKTLACVPPEAQKVTSAIIRIHKELSEICYFMDGFFTFWRSFKNLLNCCRPPPILVITASPWATAKVSRFLFCKSFRETDSEAVMTTI